ncbi:MAG: hypothetical protein LC114_01610 [Bryobacterales bacterium]|nr:hypothetical protein [Bryobacterales bacterium]
MTNKAWIAANAGYAAELIRCAWAGASSTWKTSPSEERIPLQSDDAATVLATAALGVATGVVSGFASTGKNRGRHAVVGGLLGGSIAVAGAAAWGMRTIAGKMVKGAARQVEDRRNLHWLEHNPINYA